MKSIYVLQENFSKAIIKTEGNSDFKWNRESQLQRAKHIIKGIRMEGKIMKLVLKDAKSSSSYPASLHFRSLRTRRHPPQFQGLQLIASCSVDWVSVPRRQMSPWKFHAFSGDAIKRTCTPKEEKELLSQQGLNSQFHSFPPDLNLQISLCFRCASLSWRLKIRILFSIPQGKILQLRILNVAGCPYYVSQTLL